VSVLAIIEAMQEAGCDDATILRAVMAAERKRMKALADSPPWPIVRAQALERDGNTCQYCGSETETPHVDHVVPLCQGGGHDLKNLVVACPSCNLSKGGRTPEQWRQNPARCNHEAV
jgi:5-methylcytosine-specific restriction endonuclease McrA